MKPSNVQNFKRLLTDKIKGGENYMLKQKQAYLLAVTLAQIVCALAFLLLTAGQPPALLYGMAAAPVLLFLTFLLREAAEREQACRKEQGL